MLRGPRELEERPLSAHPEFELLRLELRFSAVETHQLLAVGRRRLAVVQERNGPRDFPESKMSPQERRAGRDRRTLCCWLQGRWLNPRRIEDSAVTLFAECVVLEAQTIATVEMAVEMSEETEPRRLASQAMERSSHRCRGA